MSIQNPRVVRSFSIASGVAVSSGIDLEGYRIAAIDMSSGWDAANRMTFRVSKDGSSYADLYDGAGNPYQIASGTPLTSATGRSIVPDTALALALATHRYVKIHSGPATAPASLTTGVSFDIILLPL
jgi:hypothetical protein